MSDHEASQPPPPPPPPPAPPSRPLLRRDEHKHLAGVAGGLADYLGVEAGGLRFAFVLLALFGVGVPLYIAGWLVMPSPRMPQSYFQRWFGTPPSPVLLVTVAAGLFVLFTLFDGPGHDGGPDWGLGWGLALLLGGWLLFRADRRAHMTAGAPVMGPPTPWPPASAWHGPGGTAYTPPVAAPSEPRPPSILGRATVGVALASLGVAALLEQLRVVALEPHQYAALALAIVGLGLIVGAWAGRAYGLIAAGLLLLPVLFVLSMPPLPVGSGAGDFRYAPTTVAALRDSYTLGAGELELDLSDLELNGATEQVHVGVGAGQTTIIVPDDVTVAATVEVAAGDAELFGQRYVGEPFMEQLSQTFEGTSAQAGRLELHVEHGLGQIIVRRESQES